MSPLPTLILVLSALWLGTGCGTTVNDAKGSGGTTGGASAGDNQADAGASTGGSSSGEGTGGDGTTGGNGQDTPEAGTPPPLHGAPYVVGTIRLEVDATGGRKLPVQVWYPAIDAAAAEAEAGRPMEDFEPPGEHHDALAKLVADAPDVCTRKTMNAADAPDAYLRVDAFPLLVFSHCMDCIRFSAFSIAEHLASLGFVVAAPDHVDGTLYDNKGTLTTEFLKTRLGDIQSVLDVMLDENATVVPERLRGRIDATRVGMFGHSYGSVTTGLVLQTDPRVKAGVMIAAPPESPLLAGVTIKDIPVPGLFFEATEDGSITALGNVYIENNFNDYPQPAWLVKVEDAGHWSFSDIAGLGDTFEPGCGMGTRVTQAPFTYLDIEVARDIAKSYIAAFFQKELLGDAQAGTYLDSATPENIVTLSHHD